MRLSMAERTISYESRTEWSGAGGLYQGASGKTSAWFAPGLADFS